MPSDNSIKNNKCIICGGVIPKGRVGNAITCKKYCSKIYSRVYHSIVSRIVSKHIIENKKLKLKLKQVIENDKH